MTHDCQKAKLNKIFDTTIRSRQFVIVQNHSGQSVIAKKKKKKKASFVKNIQVNFAIFSYDMYILFFFISLKKEASILREKEREGGGGLVRGTFKFSMINVFTLSLIRANFLSFHV